MILFYQTKGNTDIRDITRDVEKVVEKERVQEGAVLIFVKGSTAAITAIEADDNLYNDFREVLDKIIPMKNDWRHHRTWGDNNGGAHLRASMIGPQLTVPILDGRMLLGTWQKIVLIDFDTSERERQVIVSLLRSFNR